MYAPQTNEILVLYKAFAIHGPFKQESNLWPSHAERQIGKANGLLGPNNMLPISQGAFKEEDTGCQN